MYQKKKKRCSSVQFQLSNICTYFMTRYLEAHRCCRGSGGPSSARLRLQGWRSPWGSGRAQFAPRSNRSELGARLPVCWWWFSLSLPSATCQSACSMSWKGKLSAARCYKAQKALGVNWGASVALLCLIWAHSVYLLFREDLCNTEFENAAHCPQSWIQQQCSFICYVSRK